MLDTENIEVNKGDNIPALMEFTFLWGKQGNSK